MTEQVYNDVSQVIEKMAKSLGVAAEHVYGILVRQQIADGVVTLVMFTVVLLALGITAKIAHTKLEKAQEETPWKSSAGEGWEIIVFGTLLLFGLTFMVAMFVVPGAIKQLINPEYYAIKEILDTLKGASE